MAKRIIELPQSKSDFTVVGKLIGVKKDKFYEDKKSKNGNPLRLLKFAIEYEKDKKINVELMGMPKQNVYFYRAKDDKKGVTKDTKTVAWENRATFKQEGYNIIGVNIGLEKKIDEEGKEKINWANMVEHDACAEIARQLEQLGDGVILRVNGKIEQNCFMGKDDTIIRNQKLIIDKICISSEEVKEESESKNHYFHQHVVIKEVTQDNELKCFNIDGFVVGYNEIHPVCLHTKITKFAQMLSRNAKKQSFGVVLYGEMEIEKDISDIEVEDEWGNADEAKKQNSYSNVRFYATGGDKESLDTTTYTEEEMDKAIALIAKDKKIKQEFDGVTAKANNIELATAEDEDGFADWD